MTLTPPDGGATYVRNKRRVALVHYTATPAVGGVESLIDSQYTSLRSLGFDALRVVGNPAARESIDTVIVPAMQPTGVRNTSSSTAGTQMLLAQLRSILSSCTDCWIHNALTVSLHPNLSRALMLLVQERPDIRWIGWTADITAISEYSHPAAQEVTEIARALRYLVRWVAISHARRETLSLLLGLPLAEITVIHPPIDWSQWLGLGAEALDIIRRTQLVHSFPTVLVPAKALSHKGLGRTLRLASGLIRAGYTPRILITAASSPHDPNESEVVRASLRAAIHALALPKVVILISDLLEREASRLTVRELMQTVDAVFFPSREEGFGMPLREAALLRVPVVCSDLPVFREVAGEAALYFSEADVENVPAALVAQVAGDAPNIARREAMLSSARFRTQLEGILHGDA